MNSPALRLAQLAKEKKYHVLLNLIHRTTPIITHEEYREEFDGRTAFQWAIRIVS
jgi:hypothetical protein